MSLQRREGQQIDEQTRQRERILRCFRIIENKYKYPVPPKLRNTKHESVNHGERVSWASEIYCASLFGGMMQRAVFFGAATKAVCSVKVLFAVSSPSSFAVFNNVGIIRALR